jgi:hypothetical protein
VISLTGQSLLSGSPTQLLFGHACDVTHMPQAALCQGFDRSTPPKLPCPTPLANIGYPYRSELRQCQRSLQRNGTDTQGKLNVWLVINIKHRSFNCLSALNMVKIACLHVNGLLNFCQVQGLPGTSPNIDANYPPSNIHRQLHACSAHGRPHSSKWCRPQQRASLLRGATSGASL